MPSNVLIIDNNQTVADLLGKQMQSKGYVVSKAYDGAAGIRQAKETQPDIILLDILNPNIDGFKVLKSLKSDECTSQIPVVLTSIIENIQEEGIELGAVDFLAKPFNLEYLYATVEHVLKSEKILKVQTVLVIDDEESVLEMTKDYLESKDLRVFSALSGQQGINIARKEDIGLILLDLRMPGMDGYEVIKELKKNLATCNIPVIVVTSIDIEQCREKCLMLGAKECYTKPYDKEVLMNTVNNVLNKTTKNGKKVPQTISAKILIADDEEIIRELVKDTLELHGYTMIVAKDGKEALEKIYAESPDIIILDVKMPYMTGFEVCSKIREDVLMSNLPIIMLTAKGSEADEIKGLELGVDDYLTKPFRPAILLARVKAAFSRTQHGLNVSPLTYLPGNTSIARNIEMRLKSGEDFAVLYVDIDRFKSYNDYYGFYKGDEIIKATARILVDVIKRMNPEGNFIGHIGGDDFICVIDEDKIDEICSAIINEFDEAMSQYYNKEDWDKGIIIIENRKGEVEEFPIVALSIGVVRVAEQAFIHMGEISKLGTELKKYAKKNVKSNYVLDRRAE
ncbi:MAG: response regulator [Elusimicrobiota bacterium]